MLLTGHQPNYLPYLGFFEKIAKADMYLVVDNVQFVKRGPFGWIHRNKIRTSNGWQWLSLDCLTKGQFTQNINEVRLKPGSPHLRKHWRAIEVNYAKAPHFEAFAKPFRDIYLETQWEMMVDLNVALIKAVMTALGLETPVDSTSRLGISGKASELIINMCEVTGADRYLSGVHGKDYLDMGLFEQAGITVEFQNYPHPAYEQCHQGEFEPYMCALDAIFNLGNDARALIQ